jgi:tRNA G37 N-methylase TrmD
MDKDNGFTAQRTALSPAAAGKSREQEAFDLLSEVKSRICECGRIDELDEDLIERIDAYLSRPADEEAPHD